MRVSRWLAKQTEQHNAASGNTAKLKNGGLSSISIILLKYNLLGGKSQNDALTQ